MPKKGNYLYHEIYSDLKDLIESGSLAVGDKVPTEYEIMNKYSVCRITATRSLNELAEQGYIIRKRRSGSFVSSPHSITRSSVTPANRSNGIRHVALVSVFTSCLGGYELFSDFMQNAFQNNLVVSVFISQNDIETERNILKNLDQMDLDAVLSVPVESFENIGYYQRLQNKGVPVLFVDRHISWCNIPYITFTNENSMYRMTKWLIEQQFRDIAFCFGSPQLTTEAERLRGYISALNEYHIVPDEHHIICLGYDEIYDQKEKHYKRSEYVYKCLKKFLDTDTLPEVIVCVNDITAEIVITQAKSLGLNVPEDLSVTGFEDTHSCHSMMPLLTTMRQNYDKLGEKVIETLDRMQSNLSVSSPICVDTQMIIRDSVKINQGE